jgi:hypothetical protein
MKTAMQELIEYAHDLDFGGWEDVFIQKATELLEKEKKQIIDAYINGYTSYDSEMSGFEYYTQTHNKNK